MGIVDRTDELIVSMLARRSRQPVPEWLLDRTLAAVAAEPQDHGRRRWSVPGAPAIDGRLAIAGAAGMVLVGLALGVLATGGLRSPWAPVPSQAAVVAATSPSASATPTGPPSPTPGPSPSARQSTAPAAAALAPDTLAVVTQKGFDLRVRSAPGLGKGSIELWPLLDSGTRLLVIGGPVAADGYDWYEVMVEGQPDAMYGWVAAAGDGTRWIRPAAAECQGAPRRRDVADMRPFDFLVCYHAREVTITARISEVQSGVEVACPLLGDNQCDIAEGWLLHSTYFTFTANDGKQRTVGISVPPVLQPVLADVPDGAALTLTVAMDAPEARSCRITDPTTGVDLVEPNRVITVCRLAFALRAAEITP